MNEDLVYVDEGLKFYFIRAPWGAQISVHNTEAEAIMICRELNIAYNQGFYEGKAQYK